LRMRSDRVEGGALRPHRSNAATCSRETSSGTGNGGGGAARSISTRRPAFAVRHQARSSVGRGRQRGSVGDRWSVPIRSTRTKTSSRVVRSAAGAVVLGRVEAPPWAKSARRPRGWPRVAVVTRCARGPKYGNVAGRSRRPPAASVSEKPTPRVGRVAKRRPYGRSSCPELRSPGDPRHVPGARHRNETGDRRSTKPLQVGVQRFTPLVAR